MLTFDVRVKSVTANAGRNTVKFTFEASLDEEMWEKARIVAHHQDKGVVTLTVDPKQMELVPSSEG